MDKTKVNIQRLRAYDENPWDENDHPRAANGQFTSGSSNTGKKPAQGIESQNLKYFKTLLPKAAGTSYDLALVVRRLILHMEDEGMTTAQAIAAEDKVVSEGNIGGSLASQNILKRRWRDFKDKYMPSEEDLNG